MLPYAATIPNGCGVFRQSASSAANASPPSILRNPDDQDELQTRSFLCLFPAPDVKCMNKNEA